MQYRASPERMVHAAKQVVEKTENKKRGIISVISAKNAVKSSRLCPDFLIENGTKTSSYERKFATAN